MKERRRWWELKLVFARRRRWNGRGDRPLLGLSDEVGADVKPLLVEGVDRDFDLVLGKG